MKIAWCAFALTLASLAPAAEVNESETIERRFAAHRTVAVDTVWGGIRVTGGNGREIRLIARKHLWARSPEDAEKAKKEVRLDLSESQDAVRAYVDGPFRCQDCCCCGSNSRRRDADYRVAYDFELQVPAETDLQLKTVLDGDVEVRGVSGHLELSNVNGRVTAEEIAGTGSLTTVNGPVRATFLGNPTGPWSFKTINGELNTVFPKSLSADLRLKTWHGEILTDFDVTGLPDEAPKTEHRGGKTVYRTAQFQGVRIARGGPELRYDTLNGTIRISSR